MNSTVSKIDILFDWWVLRKIYLRQKYHRRERIANEKDENARI